MVVREDGSKWACSSCLRGHRVSGCTHTDRELTLVPKKGRPVTQCQHCRLERKKRSAHVKCDCGEVEKPHHPKEKCIHLREAEDRIKSGLQDDLHREDDPHHLAAVAEEQGCCCHHGGRCTCSIVKKESQTEDGTTPPHGPAVHKPRLESTRSDGHITVFANGHHKPVHKRNHAAHESGMPYKIPMPRSHTDQNVANAARRSVDSLALDSNMPWNPIPVGQRTMSPISISKSEQPSPRQTAIRTRSGDLPDAKILSLDFNALGPVQTNQSVDSTMSDTSMFPPLEPMSAVTDGGFDPWSVLPSTDSSMPNNNSFGAWATTFDNSNGAQPALTAASSGTQSEIDELPTMDDMYGYSMPSIQEDTVIPNASQDDTGTGNVNRRSLPPGFFGNADFSLPAMPNEWQTPVGSIHSSDSGKSRPAASEQSLAASDVWNTPTMPTMTSISQRSTNVTATTGRLQSHSIGPGSAPNDDLIRQLFPEIDFNNALFGAASSPAMNDNTVIKRLGTVLPAIPSSSSAMDLSSLNEATTGFTPQPWSDGSVSVPADAFTSPYNLEPDFSTQDFSGNWYS